VYHPQLEQLTAFATAAEFQEQVLQAKAEHFARTGEIFEDDRSYESRMATFLEYYLFDRVLEPQGVTPAELFRRARHEQVGPEEREILEGFTHTLHALFEVRKLHPGGVRVRDLFTGVDHEVFERRSVVGMAKGDILEARLIPNGGHQLFSQAFRYHPKEARKAILREIKRRKKKAPESLDPEAFLETLSRMALKVDRYRSVAVEAIYAFDPKA